MRSIDGVAGRRDAGDRAEHRRRPAPPTGACSPPTAGRRRRPRAVRSSCSPPCRWRARRRRSPASATATRAAPGARRSPRRAGPTTSAASVGHRGEEVRRLMEQLLEPAVGRGEELADLLRRRLVERARRGQVIDEVPVALVGRDAPRRRVRLDEVALLLEHGHLVAHGRRRHLDRRHLGDQVRTDRLGRRDVLLHDGTQDRCLPIIEHVPPTVAVDVAGDAVAWRPRLPHHRGSDLSRASASLRSAA